MDMIVSMRLETAIQGPLLSAEQWRLWGDWGDPVETVGSLWLPLPFTYLRLPSSARKNAVIVCDPVGLSQFAPVTQTQESQNQADLAYCAVLISPQPRKRPLSIYPTWIRNITLFWGCHKNV